MSRYILSFGVGFQMKYCQINAWMTSEILRRNKQYQNYQKIWLDVRDYAEYG